jgi:type II secretory pathway pseudopilin PulG
MMSTTSQANKKKIGLTLIEVLVVLVILVIGILTVVQLFPAGFGVMRGSENASAADRLAQQELEMLKQNGTPDGIYTSIYDASSSVKNYVFDPTKLPTNLDPAATIAGIAPPGPPNSPAASDLNKFRYISNETFTISATNVLASNISATAVTPTPIHVLNFGPIYLSNPATPQLDVQVNSANWKQTTGNSAADTQSYDTSINAYDPIDRPNEILTPGDASYMIDYNAGMLAVAAEGYDQYFVFTVEAGASGSTPTYQTIHLKVPKLSGPSGYSGKVWFTPASMQDSANYPGETLSGSWIPGTATMYRPFKYTLRNSFDSDPYEFNLNESTLSGAQGNQTINNCFNIGVLAFNPAMVNQQGTQSLVARASYMAYDWHILHEDHDLPVSGQAGNTGAAFTTRLAINDIKKVGDVQTDGTTSTGVVLGAAGTDQYDFLLLNLDTGFVSTVGLDSNVYDDDANSGASATTAVHASFRNGRITIPTPVTDVSGTAMTHVRIYYRGTADWGVGLQRAAVQYVSVPSGKNQSYFSSETSLVPPTVPPLVQPNLYYYDTTVTPNTIYFPLCEAHKAIELTNVAITVGTGSGAKSASIASLTIHPGDGAGQVSTATGSQYVLDNLSTEKLVEDQINLLTGGTAPTSVAITFQSVAGVSAQAVVIWRERNVWKKHTLDTILSNG